MQWLRSNIAHLFRDLGYLAIAAQTVLGCVDRAFCADIREQTPPLNMPAGISVFAATESAQGVITKRVETIVVRTDRFIAVRVDSDVSISPDSRDFSWDFRAGVVWYPDDTAVLLVKGRVASQFSVRENGLLELNSIAGRGFYGAHVLAGWGSSIPVTVSECGEAGATQTFALHYPGHGDRVDGWTYQITPTHTVEERLLASSKLPSPGDPPSSRIELYRGLFSCQQLEEREPDITTDFLRVGLQPPPPQDFCPLSFIGISDNDVGIGDRYGGGQTIEFRDGRLRAHVPEDVRANIVGVAKTVRNGFAGDLNGVDRFTRRGMVQDRAIYNRSARDNFCGLYVSAAALRIFGREVDVRDVVDLEYVDHKEGSSAAAIVELLDLHGIEGRISRGVSVADLGQFNDMAVLHVAPTPRTDATHYILFLGTDEGQALIYDPPGPIQRISFAELATRFYGTAIALRDRTVIDGGNLEVLSQQRFRRAILLAAVLAASVVLSSILMRRIGRPWVTVSLMTIPIIAVVALQSGPLQRGLGVAKGSPVELQTFSGNLIASVEEYLQLTEALGRPVMIDARNPNAYSSGMLDGALLLAPGADQKERLDAILPRANWSTLLLVFCEGTRCPLAEEMARTLIEDGFEQVYVLKMDWRQLPGAPSG